MNETRYVVIHAPGPAWQPDRPMFEQPGLQGHIDHYRPWLAEGKLALGGPFLDDGGGGMMIPQPHLGEDEVRAFALADPAVACGLLNVQVRAWMVGKKA
jgi:uncharacterized protein YciI